MLAVLIVMLAATGLRVGIARGSGLQDQHSVQTAAHRIPQPYSSTHGSCTFALSDSPTTQGLAWHSDNDTKLQRHKNTSTGEEHLIRKKRSFLPGLTQIHDNRNTDQGNENPVGEKTATVSLSRLLTAMARRLSNCELVLAYDDHYSDPRVLGGVLALSNVKQVSSWWLVGV